MSGVWILIIVYTGNYSATSMQVAFDGPKTCEIARKAMVDDKGFYGTAICAAK